MFTVEPNGKNFYQLIFLGEVSFMLNSSEQSKQSEKKEKKRKSSVHEI